MLLCRLRVVGRFEAKPKGDVVSLKRQDSRGLLIRGNSIRDVRKENSSRAINRLNWRFRMQCDSGLARFKSFTVKDITMVMKGEDPPRHRSNTYRPTKSGPSRRIPVPSHSQLPPAEPEA